MWVFNNSGTTTLNGVNTFNTGSTYIRNGTVVLNNSLGTTIHDDNDTHVFQGATLKTNVSETIGQLYMQRGAKVEIGAGTTLTVDDSGAQLIAGEITGAGNLTLAGGNYMAMYGTNTGSGMLSVSNGTLQLGNVTNAIGNLGSEPSVSLRPPAILNMWAAVRAYSGDLNLAGSTGGARITANGTAALTLSGNIAITAAGNKTLTLSGQTGGFFEPIKNQITGTITEGANVLSVSMAANANDDRFGVTGRWALTNKNNDFSGGITVNVGMLEIGGVLDDGGIGLGGLGDGTGATSSMGDLTAVHTINLGTNNFDGRRYDAFGSGGKPALSPPAPSPTR